MTPRALSNNPVRLVRAEPTELWEVDLPWTAPPLSLNDRGHWHTKGRKIADVRLKVGLLMKSKRLGPFHRVRVALHYRPRDRQRRDTDNPLATLKVCCDAIVDAGLVPDDEPRYMVKEMPVFHDVDRALGPALWLTVEALPGEDGGADRVDVVPPRLRPRLPTNTGTPKRSTFDFDAVGRDERMTR